MDHTQFEDILAHAGPGLQAVKEISSLGDAAWAVLFEDGSQVTIESGGPGGGVGLSCTLGRPAVDRRFVVYEAMLSFNALARENGGARVGLHGQDGELVLELDLPPQAFTAAQLEDLLARFHGAALQWRGYVELEPERLELPPPFLLHALRA
jgi:hypothetical protein